MPPTRPRMTAGAQKITHIVKGTNMARNILILGASYGSLLGTKLLMAGHNVTLVCRPRPPS